MANILIFEDNFSTVDHIHLVLEETPHEIVGEADTLLKAQLFISKILSNDIAVDVLLLDGNLDRRNDPTEFRHTFPLDGTEPVQKTMFGKVKPPQPREIVVSNSEQGFGAHARMIKKILTACDITVPIIGISAETMERSGVGVDFDLGKGNIVSGLVDAVEQLTAQQAYRP